MVSLLKKAGLTFAGRAGKGACLIAKKLAFQQIFRQSRAVHSNKGLLGSGAGSVDTVGEKLLAGAGLTGEQYIGIDPAELFGHVNLAAHPLADGDDVPEGVFGGQPPPYQTLPDMLFLLQNPGGGGGGDQGTDGRGLAADEPVFHHIALAVDVDHFLVAILAGRGPAADIGEIRPDVCDGGASPLRQEGQTVQSIGLVIGLQKLSGFIQSKNGVLAAVEDGADNMALCAL